MNSLLFSDFSKVVGMFRPERVVIVGSGPTALENEPGFIDSFSVVVRVNNYKIKGEKSGIKYDYSKSLGSRTDVFYSFFGSSIGKTSEELRADGVTLCMSKLPNSSPIESEWHVHRGKPEGIDYRPHYRRRENWWFCPTFVPDDLHFLETFNFLGKHQATTGFSAIYDFVKIAPKALHITGFDFFESGVHNVDETHRMKNLDDPIGHRPKLEKEKVLQFARENSWITLDPHLTKLL